MSIFGRLFGRDPVAHAIDVLGELKSHEYVDQTHHTPQSPYGDSADLYTAAARLIDAAKFPDATKFAERVVAQFVRDCDDRKALPPHDSILLQMVGTAAGIYSWEQLTHLPPSAALFEPATAGFARDYLLQQQLKAADPEKTLRAISDILVASFHALTKHLPALAFDGPINEEVPTLPLIDLIPNAPQAVDDVLSVFRRPNQLNVLQCVADRIRENVETLSEKARSKRIIEPSDYEGSPRELVEAYLTGTGFDSLFQTAIPFEIQLEDRGEHTAIVAGSGWGKTQLLQSIIAGDIEYEDPPAIVVIDSTGAMVQRIQRLAVFNDRLEDRLLIIDPELDPVPALNPFDVSNPRFSTYDEAVRERMQGEVIDLFNYVFSTIKNPLTTRMETAFAFMVRLLLSIPSANIHTLLDLLDDSPPKGAYEQAKFKEQIDKLDETTRHFFKSQYYTGHSDALREQIRARVFDILRVPAFERMFSSVNKVDFFTELNRGSIVLVNTSENLLKDGSATFGRYIIARVMAAAFERAPIPPETRRPAFLIVDEAAPYFDETFEKLLNRVRQFKLRVVIAFQNLDQANEKLRSTIASSTAIKYAGGTGANDARWLSREMRCKPEFIMAQKRDARPPKWTQFACYVRNFTDRAVSLTVPFFSIEQMPKMSESEHAALLERNRERVAAPRDTPRPAAAEPPAPEPPRQQTPVEALAKAYADLAAAMTRADWTAVAELKNGIIPALEQEAAGVAEAKPSSPSPGPPAPRNEALPGKSEAARDWC